MNFLQVLTSLTSLFLTEEIKAQEMKVGEEPIRSLLYMSYSELQSTCSPFVLTQQMLYKVIAVNFSFPKE